MRQKWFYAIILIAALLLPERSSSQNWEPFYKDSSYFFITRGGNEIKAYRLDSVTGENYIGSLNYLRGNYPCMNRPISWFGSVRKSNDHFYFINSNDDTFKYKFDLPVNSNWVVNSKKKITAQVLKIDNKPVVSGKFDSIKLIGLFSYGVLTDTVLVSKENGVVQWKMYDSELIFIRIDEPRPITKRDIYNFHPGDIFYYDWWTQLKDPINFSTKLKINTRTMVTADSVVYTGESWTHWFSPTTKQDWIEYLNEVMSFGQLNEVVAGPYEWRHGKKFIIGEIDTSANFIGESTKLILVNGNTEIKKSTRALFVKESDTCFTFPFEQTYTDTTYVPGLGWTFLFWRSDQQSGRYTSDRMVGYEKNGILYGSQRVKTEFPKEMELYFNNPVESMLNINNPFPYDMKSVLYSISGKVVHEFLIPSGGNEMDLSGIAPGSYILRIGGSSFKLLKL